MSHKTNLSFMDTPEILQVIFPVVYSPFFFEYDRGDAPVDFDIPYINMEKGVKIGCGFWAKSPELPTILYFHGNGETVADYRWSAQFYNDKGINLFVADYRGYGFSSGKPTITTLVNDAHSIFRGFKKILAERGFCRDYFVMGRSLGSIPAVELAYHCQKQCRGLIIESGASTNFQRMWKHLSRSAEEKQDGDKFTNKYKMRTVEIPTLIIHGEYDQIIPVREGVELYEASGAAEKEIIIIPGADHNNLMLKGHEQYFSAVEDFVRMNSVTIK
jgi:alpha-beta hydrolase superfamily lysophospholipase